MTVRISKSEMELLAYLHEHASGCGPMFPQMPNDVRTTLGIKQEQLDKELSFLAGYNLANGAAIGVATMNTRPGLHTLQTLWITHEGENLMRKVEEEMKKELLEAPDYQQSRGAKLTAKAAAWLMDKAADAVIAIVAANITKN